MKVYVVTMGVVFALIVLAHVARLVAGGPHLLREPVIIFTPALSTLVLQSKAY